jgi:hypothetical protein
MMLRGTTTNKQGWFGSPCRVQTQLQSEFVSRMDALEEALARMEAVSQGAAHGHGVMNGCSIQSATLTSGTTLSASSPLQSPPLRLHMPGPCLCSACLSGWPGSAS